MAEPKALAAVAAMLLEEGSVRKANEANEAIFMMFGLASTIRENKSRIFGYGEEVVPLYTDTSFRRKFRMSRSTFREVFAYLKDCPELQNEGSGGRPPIPVEKQLLMTLWYVGSLDNIDRLADRFGISESSVIRCRDRIVHAINLHLKKRFIKWPERGPQMQEVVHSFSERNGFPGIIGALDGTHVKVKKPIEQPARYINRKGFYSLQLQAVCKLDLAFTHVYVGYPGSCHDARVLTNSDLWLNGLEMCDTNHIIADAAYPLRRWLLTPFRDNGHLDREQVRYNHYHSANRMVVERSFGLLKGRFRRLHDLETVHIPTAVDIIMTCCILHNICIMHHDDVADFLDTDPIVNVNANAPFQNTPAEGTLKRATISRLLR